MARKSKAGDTDAAEAASAHTPTESSGNAAGATREGDAPAPAGPLLRVLAQYTKDVSFENPNAPASLRADQPAPQIQIGIEIGRQMFDDDTVEVSLMLKAEAQRETGVVFIAELEYAGLFAFQGVTVETLQPMILIECPRLLFPFARQIMAEMTQNGGFPPIMLEPPDFAAMFRDEMLRRAQQQQTQPPMGEPQGSA